MEMFFIVWLTQGIIFGGFCAFIASQKNRDSGGWFLLGFLFSILAVLALIAIPKIPKRTYVNQLDAIRTCPYCAEQVKAKATICRFCQKDLPELNPDVSMDEDDDVNFDAGGISAKNINLVGAYLEQSKDVKYIKYMYLAVVLALFWLYVK